jgi:hypothetical protein
MEYGLMENRMNTKLISTRLYTTEAAESKKKVEEELLIDDPDDGEKTLGRIVAQAKGELNVHTAREDGSGSSGGDREGSA